jgi:hypothetical protein
MTKPGWTLDDIAWERFDPSKVDQDLLMAVKAASVVEYNARDYVGYLKAVFPGDAAMHALFEHWGLAETQHGLARGAFAFVGKPTSADGLNSALSRIKSFSAPRRKRLLIVDDNQHEQESIQALLGHDDIDITAAGTGTAAMIALRLHGARPQAAGHVGLRRAGANARRVRAA